MINLSINQTPVAVEQGSTSPGAGGADPMADIVIPLGTFARAGGAQP